MRTDEFIELWKNEDLHRYIVSTAKRRNRLPQIQEEFIQEAALVLSCAPAGRSIEAYKSLSDRAIYSAYWQTRKEYMLHQSLSEHFNGALSMVRAYQEDD